MFENVIFYNHFGAGDIFESREFVKEYIKDIPANNYFYAHGKSPIILKDIPLLKYAEVTSIMDPSKKFVIENNNLYINTWIGRESKYVLPGIGCIVEKLVEMHNDIRQSLNLPLLTKDPLEYIPTIDFSYYHIENINKFIENNKLPKVLVCTGPVQSCQAYNFNMLLVVCQLAKHFEDILFIITTNDTPDYPNITSTYNIIKSNDCDLNEIGYLSKFTDIIIGRSSGPHVFSQHKENILDPTKTNISITYKPTGGFFTLLPTPMRKIWIGFTDYNKLFLDLGNIIFNKIKAQ